MYLRAKNALFSSFDDQEHCWHGSPHNAWHSSAILGHGVSIKTIIESVLISNHSTLTILTQQLPDFLLSIVVRIEEEYDFGIFACPDESDRWCPELTCNSCPESQLSTELCRVLKIIAPIWFNSNTGLSRSPRPYLHNGKLYKARLCSLISGENFQLTRLGLWCKEQPKI